MSTVTRFAPSPTGLLHIGGVRTALFKFILTLLITVIYVEYIYSSDKITVLTIC